MKDKKTPLLLAPSVQGGKDSVTSMRQTDVSYLETKLDIRIQYPPFLRRMVEILFSKEIIFRTNEPVNNSGLLYEFLKK